MFELQAAQATPHVATCCGVLMKSLQAYLGFLQLMLAARNGMTQMHIQEEGLNCM